MATTGLGAGGTTYQAISDEEKGREAYEREAKNWPSPLGWDKLPAGSKRQWILRATKVRF